jgi:glycosyltransferase involved in cell wall biosynthesis/cellulose synthase/poly-beta-1,6-N-acetylglucosamine synthase-like glycosyltransferase/O-antigen/teichoic acid export membrane protein
MADLDVIIPVYNEQDSIFELVARIDKSLKKANISCNIVFIDDYSVDNTAQKIKKFVGKNGFTNPVNVIYEAKQRKPNSSVNVKYFLKKGKKGKAYSILEGARYADSEYICMIDGDLQYPPEAIPSLFKLAKRYGIAVANRKNYKTSFLRKSGSKLNKFLFERFLLGFKHDMQSGLKVFKKEIIDNLREKEVTPWTLDMLLLKIALDLGYEAGTLDIVFEDRKEGKSKISIIDASYEIAINAIKLKFKRNRIIQVNPKDYKGQIGVGVTYEGKNFITHTNLHHQKSALITFHLWQKITLLLIGILTAGGLIINPIGTGVVILGILSIIYLLDLLFSSRLLLKSLNFPPEINISEDEINSLKNDNLPIYTILCPLYKEANVLRDFVDAINKISWPKEKLDVLLLLEEDDVETINKANSLDLGEHFSVVVVPHSYPKTKPKACNYGFAKAKGEYCVIYDAEDRPDPYQLKKSYIAFSKLDSKVVCLQSKLNYYNTNHNLLTRLFTAEYSLWFDLILPSLQSIKTAIPLGGTSNHFKTSVLRYLCAWDPFNVTEDCDLGVRLFKEGFKTAIINSTTYEEANSRVKSWLKQRSRWIKGYLQTYLVHMRDPLTFVKDHGVHALVFQLVIGMRMVFILVNPILWIATVVYLIFNQQVEAIFKALYPAPFYYFAVFTLIFGNFFYFYKYMIGLAKRKQWDSIKYVYFVPLYWAMTSISAVIAFYQLVKKPHYWEKTQHGLHLQPKVRLSFKDIVQSWIQPISGLSVSYSLSNTLNLIKSKLANNYVIKSFAYVNAKVGKTAVGGGVLVVSSMLVNLLNFLYNAYLGRSVSLGEFGLISTLGNIFALSGIVTFALSKTVSYKAAKLLGKFNKPVKEFLLNTKYRGLIFSVGATLVWILSIPFLTAYFNSASMLPFILFSPVWLIVFLGSINYGYLSGNLKFDYVAYFIVVESVSKLLLTILFVSFGYTHLVYVVIPISLLTSYLSSSYLIRNIKENYTGGSSNVTFPKKFFSVSILSSLSVVAFLNFDVVLARHYLEPIQAGQYALLALSGKIIYLLNSLFSRFVNPLISKKEGERKESKSIFTKLLAASSFTSIFGFILIGILGRYTVPILFGTKAFAIVDLLPLYTLGITCFSIANTFSIYHQARKEYIFPLLGFVFAVVQILYIVLIHNSILAISSVVGFSGIIYLIAVSILHRSNLKVDMVSSNLSDFFGLFNKPMKHVSGTQINLRVLIFNWRDTKHVWSGGAEVYIHELAKRWIKKGYQVTVFCGSDRKGKSDEIVDGVYVIRRGGFFTVYLWAFLYYVFHFRKKYDVVIDCENGIPFFTPIFCRLPKILLIHHVHQEIFRKRFGYILSKTAEFLETRLMPFVYSKVKMVTVSESSKRDMLKIGLGKYSPIEIINPAINPSEFAPGEKTATPTVLYLGRLMPWKSIDTLVEAMRYVVKTIPDVKLRIAGFGESRNELEILTKNLGLQNVIKFLGKVDESTKRKLMSSSWVFVYPSLMEGWGMSAIEANASGTVVIASDVPGLRDSVKNPSCGILVEKRNVEQFAEKILLVLTNENIRKNLEAESIKWARKFAWNKSANMFLEIIQNELKRRISLVPSKRLVFVERKI